MGFVRRHAEAYHRQVEENMVHRCIADGGDFVYLFFVDSGRLAQLHDEGVYAVDYCPVKLCEFLIGLGVCDSADDVVTELDLRI